MEGSIKNDVQAALANQTREYVVEIPEYANLTKLAESLDLLTPFGEGNREPIFKISDMKVERVSYMGQDKKHMKISFERHSAFAGLADVSADAKKQTRQQFSVPFWNYQQTEDALRDFLIANRGEVYNLYIRISPELFNGSLNIRLVDAEAI